MPKRLPNKHPDSPDSLIELVNRGKAAVDGGHVLDGLALFELACELEPTNPDALIGKVRTLLRVGDVELAAKTCDQLRINHETPLVWALHEVVTTLYNGQNPPRHVNIGGGPFYNFCSWLNLEAVPSPSNPLPTALSPTTKIPVADESIQTAYSSHSFEHLDDETVERCLSEARRILKKNGVLVVKLPNFDDILMAWRNGDLSYFDDKTWNYEDIRKTWANKGVEDTIDSRASTLFCGFWNTSYGDHFANQQNLGSESYHGPAICNADFFHTLKEQDSPWAIAKVLRDYILNSEHEPIFNHRNAWSKDEFSNLLQKTGFRVLSTDRKDICRNHPHIFGIETMLDISNYFLAVPDGEAS